MKTKKLIALFLCLSIIFSLTAPISVAAEEEYPIVYVKGTGAAIYDAQGNKIFPVDGLGDKLKATIKPLLEEFLIGSIAGNYEKYVDKFCEEWVPVLGAYALDCNGEASDGSHINWSIETAHFPQKTSNYGILDYEFRYDWRLSPIDIAKDLERYIDKVLEVTGESKVHLISRCYGSNVAAAYLEKHFDHASEKIASVTYYTQSILGVTSLSAFFSGNITLDDEAVYNFADYYLENKDVIEDPTTKELVLALVEVISQLRLMGAVTTTVSSLVNLVKDDLFPELLHQTLGTLPAYWSMVSPEEYETARDFIFADYKDEYASLIAKTDDFYYNVQLKCEDTIKNLQDKGVKFYNFVKYNFPNYPIYKNAREQSDGCTCVSSQSFGAVAADYGHTLGKKYISSLSTDKYLSPDRTIDASTCLAPETTWFIRDLYHDNFPGVMHNIILDIVKNDITVSDGKYTQYLQYDKSSNTVSNMDDFAQSPASSALFKFINSMIRFFKAFVEFIKNQFASKAETAPAA